MNLMRMCAAGIGLALLAGCTAVNVYHDDGKAHHTIGGFRNNYAGTIDKGFSELVRWQIERTRKDVPRPAATPTPQRAPDLATIRGYVTGPGAAAGPPAITWIGHATVLVQAGGLNVVTDPMFSERASPVQFVGPRRAQPPAISLADLPPIDVVLISHNHYDHLDKASVREIARRSATAGKRTVFLVPLGLKAYAVFAPEFHWYFSGDSGYSKDFADTRARFAERQAPLLGGGFDLALIALGAYEPRWFMSAQHLDPGEAVTVHKDLGAKRSVGVHGGTFELADESLDQPPKDLAAARTAQGLKDEEFSVMAIGETRFLPPRARP